jgi:hypothetical protein
MWIRKEIQAVLWKNDTPLKWRQSTARSHSRKMPGTSVDQIALLSRNLPLFKEMAINLQSFGGSDED